ncbi:aspartate kinase [Flavicella sp.]|uniref:aspartate kinase n=1 Tax=Flavicella sp. TaxID=2957742 RepID=UPI00260F0D1D|nr:aspartate kinase [Flavicella sp.]MDG1805306.1 aspartate kinase [Flavicella sp.]
MKVLKFGGTSVGSPESIKEVAKIVSNIEGQKIVVLSAMSQTTNVLHQITDAIGASNFEEANSIIDMMIDRYKKVIEGLFSTEAVKNTASAFIEERFDFIKSYAHEGSVEIIDAIEKIIVAQGEILSTNMFSIYMNEINTAASLLSAFDFMRIDEAGEPDSDFITESLGEIIKANANTDIFITQGYICLSHLGDIDNLKRGGSDYSASLIGAAIVAEEIQIWTDIDGMHNNDPRYVDKTFSLKEISFDEAAELAYFGAKILHPQSVIPAKEKNVPVLLKDTFNPESAGTIIRNCEVPNKVRAIAAKDGITAIRIKSYRMLMAYGFLKNIFEVFEKFKTSIDMITTSEVAVSLTIDDDTNLSEIVKELEDIGSVKVDSDLSIICLAGDFSEKQKGGSAAIFNSLTNIPIRMISYGGSNYNVSLVVNSKDKIQALQDLNAGVFESK